MKRRKVIGLVLMLSSIVLCAILVAAVVFYFHQRYLGILANGHDFWPTFGDYFWQVSKTDLVCAILVGLLPVLPGAYFYCTD
jgi:hypothetical protein